jgi:hypothetical protein
VAESLASEIIRREAELQGQQANFRRYWEDLAYYVQPEQATFLVQPVEGLKRTERLFDSTATIANSRFAAAMESMLTPQSQIWHKLSPEAEDLSDDQASKEYLDQLNVILFSWRYRARAGFQNQSQIVYQSTGNFGNGILFIDEDVSFSGAGGLRYRCIPMQEAVWATDHTGRVDSLYRKFKLQNRQAVQQFGSRCPPDIVKLADSAPFAESEFIHCVDPNPDRKQRKLDASGMRYRSTYVCVEGAVEVQNGGYRTFPFAISRYAVAPKENYGRGPAMTAYPAIRTANEQKKTILRGGQKAVDPPLMLHEEGVLEAFNQRAGAVNYGMLTSEGVPLAQPLQTGANIPLGMELLKSEQTDINDAFLVSLFQFLSQQRGDETAEEVRARQAQTATMLAPTMGRMQSEFLGPLIERELDILDRMGVLPQPPKNLMQRGGGYKIIYQSTMARNMRLEEVGAIMDTVQAFGVLAQIDPDVAMLMDTMAAGREIADIKGVPSKLMRSDDDIAQLKQQKEQQQAGQEVAEHAPGLSKAALNLAQANQASAAAAPPAAAAA